MNLLSVLTLWMLLTLVALLYSWAATSKISTLKFIIAITAASIMTAIVFFTTQNSVGLQESPTAVIMRVGTYFVVFAVGFRLLGQATWRSALLTAGFSALWLTIVMAFW